MVNPGQSRRPPLRLHQRPGLHYGKESRSSVYRCSDEKAGVATGVDCRNGDGRRLDGAGGREQPQEFMRC